MTNQEIRAQVLATIADVIRQARAEGKDGVAAARAAFPGTPDLVIYEADTAVDFDEVENWWGSVERTINGELVARAIAEARQE